MPDDPEEMDDLAKSLDGLNTDDLGLDDEFADLIHYRGFAGLPGVDIGLVNRIISDIIFKYMGIDDVDVESSPEGNPGEYMFEFYANTLTNEQLKSDRFAKNHGDQWTYKKGNVSIYLDLDGD